MTLIAINVGIYLLQLAGGASINANCGWIYEHGALVMRAVASNGQSSASPRATGTACSRPPSSTTARSTSGMNMLALWWIGRPLEDYLGPVRYLLLYLVSGLAGSAGALIVSPTAVTVGASGAIFGILGAAIVLERQHTYVLGGSALTLLIVNLAFTFAVPGSRSAATSAALAGGALCILALSRFGKGSAAYSRIDAALDREPGRDRRAQRRGRLLEGEGLRLASASRRSRPRRCPAPPARPGRRRGGRAGRGTGEQLT